MKTDRLEILKGIHPGLYLNRELENRRLERGAFAKSIGVPSRTLREIIRGRKGMNVALSLKIERSLHLTEGMLMVLQVYYDIEQEKRKESRVSHPDLGVYRKVLFWDTDINSIDWIAHKRYVVNRVFERGNEAEILETIRFYGKAEVRTLLDLNRDHRYATYLGENVKKYIENE